MFCVSSYLDYQLERGEGGGGERWKGLEDKGWVWDMGWG